MLEVKGLTKYYGDLVAVSSLSFHVEEGELVTLLGPSGCGKSTTLHAIAGLVSPTEGSIHLRGQEVTHHPPEKRNIGMAFQNTALFPHMTVRENISYGLKMHGFDSSKITERVSAYLELVDLPDHGDHRPDELSGGQQQRVSLARALAYQPDILLLDEPLTGLDRVLREEMRGWLKSIQREVGVTTLYVTHDQEDALSMSDSVIVLKDGEKQQESSPEGIYEDPENPFVAEFVGKSTRLTGNVTYSDGRWVLRNSQDPIYLPDREYDDGSEVVVYIRPEDIALSKSIVDDDANALRGTVQKIANLGNRAEVFVDVGNGDPAIAHTTRFPALEVGEEVVIQFETEDVIVV